jgi:alkylhydroperoxidase family enzyme
MARISLTPPNSPTLQTVQEHFQQRLGVGLDVMNALGHQPQVLQSIVGLEQQVPKWDAVPREIKELAVMAAAVKIGCSWCVDYGYWVSVMRGIPAAKIEAVATWRDSDLFSDLERLVLDYAEAMSDTPPTVTDDMVRGLLDHLTEPQLVELTVMIAVENQRSRTFIALGMTSQGFKEQCEIPGR